MANGRCGSCGAPVPSEARYCPRCGRPVDDTAVPVFDLNASDDSLPLSADGPDGRSATTIVGVVLAVVAVLIGLSIFSDDRPEGDDEAGASTTSTTPHPSTTRPAPPSRPRPDGPSLDGEELFDPDALLDPDLGLALLWFQRDGTVVAADLATGEQQTATEDALESVEMVSWVDGTFIVSGGNGWVRRLTVDGSDGWEDLGGMYPHWGGVPGMFWVPSLDRPRLALLNPDGTISEAPIPESVNLDSLNVVGHVDGHLLANTPDGVFAFAADRTIRRAGYGTVLGVEGRYVVRRVCDDQLNCVVVRDEFVDGAFDPARQVLLLADGTGAGDPFRAYPSPDGRAVVLLSAGMPTQLHVVSIERGETHAIDGQTIDDPYGLRWIGDGKALVWWNGSNRTVNALSVDDGTLRSVPVNPRSRRSHAIVVVAPLADLPVEWRPGTG